MKCSVLITIAVVCTLFSGCESPQSPSIPPNIPEVQKGDLNKYKTMNFEEFMLSLPITYTTDRIREIPIDCKNIKPENPMMCNPLYNPMLGDFFKGLKRESERFCLAKGGYIKNRKDEMITKYLEAGQVDKAQKLKATKGWDGYTCKIDDNDYFGYLSSGAYIQFYTPKWFKSVFDVYSAEPYIELAKKKHLNIKEFTNYFEISGENTRDVFYNDIYLEEGEIIPIEKFGNYFSKDVLFRNLYLITDKEVNKKGQEFVKVSEGIIQKIVYEDYPIFKNIVSIGNIDVNIEGSLWAKIPIKAITKNGNILIFKPKIWKDTYSKILKDETPLLEAFNKLIIENTSTYVPDREMLNY